jgi:hypothetical protein
MFVQAHGRALGERCDRGHFDGTREKRTMWIRVTCPNGHPLENAFLERAARTKRCPQCNAKVSMWTKVKCPSGHILKVRTKHGGGSGTCPECKQPVSIPEFDVERIIDVLLPKAAGLPVAEIAPAPPEAPSPKPAQPVIGPRHLAQFTWEMFDKKPAAARAQAASCPSCGTIGFPGQAVCTNCGQASLAPR